MDNSKSSGIELDQVSPGGAQRLGCAWSLVLRHTLAIARTLLSRPGAIGLIRKQVLGLAACLVAWCSSIRRERHHG